MLINQPILQGESQLLHMLTKRTTCSGAACLGCVLAAALGVCVRHLRGAVSAVHCCAAVRGQQLHTT